MTLNYLDIIQGLEVTDEESPSHEPQATIFSHMLLSPKEEQEFERTTTYAASTATERDMAEYASPPGRNRERSLVCYLWWPL